MSHRTPAQVTTVTTDGSGNATWTFADPFISAPVVTPASVDATTNPVVVNVTAVSATGVSIHAAKARPLPSGLLFVAELNDYNTFAAAPGVVVHLTAVEA